MHAGLPAGRLHRAVFLVSSLGSAVSQKLMLAVLGPGPGAEPVVVVVRIRGEVTHPLVTDWARSGPH